MMNTRYIPNDAKEIKKEGLDGVVYTYEGQSGIPYAIAYSGRRNNPDFHYSYRSVEKRSEAIENFFRGLESRINLKAERKARRHELRAEFLKKIGVGSILNTCWGYEQTNVEWYQVTQLKGCTVYFRRIAADVKETSFMSGTTTPIKGKFIGEEFKRVIRGASIRIDDVVTAFLSDGNARTCSWYA